LGDGIRETEEYRGEKSFVGRCARLCALICLPKTGVGSKKLGYGIRETEECRGEKSFIGRCARLRALICLPEMGAGR